MIDHYNAFISYRHAPEDIKVAEAVQRGLERFHIPHKIRKQTGMKRIQQIFRDKDELPITSDLTDTISNALYNSDYLIVICSTNTKDSIWVQREIQFFLRNHTKNQILTVLVNGEPQDVIPEILTYEDKTVIDSQGLYQTVRNPIEPLSCDYRMPFSKARKIELPRLASALIGCSYDELMNRRRQYMIHRMELIFASITIAAAAFSFHLYKSNQEIKMNYLNSLRNQSRYLANESKHLLEDEQRVTALQLAIEALPKDENDERPVTPEAIRAITDATLAYMSDNSTYNVYCEWGYRLPDTIQEFKVSPNGKALAAYDAVGNLGVWDTETHQAIVYELSRSTNSRSGTSGIEFLSSGDLIIWGEKTIRNMDFYSASPKWVYTSDVDIFDTADLLGYNSDYIYLSGSSPQNIIKLSLADGNLVEKYELPYYEDSESTSIFSSINNPVVSPNGKYIAFTCSPELYKYVIGVYDTDTKKAIFGEMSDSYITTLDWLDDDNLLTASLLGNMSEHSMSFGETDYISTDSDIIQCFSPVDLKEKWHSDFTCNDTTIKDGFLKLINNGVLYYSGNAATVYDPKTGQILQNYNVNDSIVNVCDPNEDGIPLFILRNGNIAIPTHEGKNLLLQKYFPDNLRQAEMTTSGYYTFKLQKNEILYYGTHVYDREWTELDHNTVLTDIDNSTMTDDILGIIESRDNKLYLYVYDLNNPDTTVEALIDENPASTTIYKIIYSDKENVYVGKGSSDGFEIITVSRKNGSTSTEIISEGGLLYSPQYSSVNGILVYPDFPSYDEKLVTLYNIESKLSKSYKLPEECESFTPTSPVYYPDQNAIIYCDSNNTFIINTSTEDVATMDKPEEWEGTSLISQNALDGKYLLSDGNKTIVTTADGKIEYTINPIGYRVLGLAFYDDGIDKTEDQILIVYGNGTLYRYSAVDGHFLGKSELLLYISYVFDQKAYFEFDNENHLLYFTSAGSLSMVDTEYWVETASIPFCLGHHKPTDRFITTSIDNQNQYRIGCFEHYTTDKLIEKGLDLLQGSELSPEQKSEYGIAEDN